MNSARQMMDDINNEVRYTRDLIGKDALDARVMRVMAEVPREHFVPEREQAYAYFNHPLSIGHGQTISQPYIVALMTDLLELQPDDVILEIGTGSGYQAAILSRLVRQVYSIEIVPELAAQAKDRLRRLGYANVEVRHGDGAHGWREHAPFDGIIVTAAAPYPPAALTEQLKPGARLVIPVGAAHMHQELIVMEKSLDGTMTSREILGVAFVPLTGSGRG